MSLTGDGTPRYTLEEARKILKAEECARWGHTLEEVRTLSGTVGFLSCTNCGQRFVPQEER